MNSLKWKVIKQDGELYNEPIETDNDRRESGPGAWLLESRLDGWRVVLMLGQGADGRQPVRFSGTLPFLSLSFLLLFL